LRAPSPLSAANLWDFSQVPVGFFTGTREKNHIRSISMLYLLEV